MEEWELYKGQITIFLNKPFMNQRKDKYSYKTQLPTYKTTFPKFVLPSFDHGKDTNPNKVQDDKSINI